MGTQLTQETHAKLRSLESLLSSLPDTIPFGETCYQFIGFTPSKDDLELYGTAVAAFNHTLEVTFCPGGRVNGVPINLMQSMVRLWFHVDELALTSFIGYPYIRKPTNCAIP